MGTGKSAVGRLLAKRLNRPFLDLDKSIEKEIGQTVPQIFEREGEAGFRRLEKQAVQRAAALNGHVVATGGGVMMDEENIRTLKSSGVLVCLTANPDVILKRTEATLAFRPMLGGGNPRERIEELLRLRAPFYAQADVTMDTTDRLVHEVAEEILKRIGGVG